LTWCCYIANKFLTWTFVWRLQQINLYLFMYDDVYGYQRREAIALPAAADNRKRPPLAKRKTTRAGTNGRRRRNSVNTRSNNALNPCMCRLHRIRQRSISTSSRKPWSRAIVRCIRYLVACPAQWRQPTSHVKRSVGRSATPSLHLLPSVLSLCRHPSALLTALSLYCSASSGPRVIHGYTAFVEMAGDDYDIRWFNMRLHERCSKSFATWYLK